MMPDAALHVHSSVNSNGVSGQIAGEGPADTGCEAVVDIETTRLLNFKEIY